MSADLEFEGGLRASPPRRLPLAVTVERIMPHPDGRLLLDSRRDAAAGLQVLRDWQALGAGGG